MERHHSTDAFKVRTAHRATTCRYAVNLEADGPGEEVILNTIDKEVFARIEPKTALFGKRNNSLN